MFFGGRVSKRLVGHLRGNGGNAVKARLELEEEESCVKEAFRCSYCWWQILVSLFDARLAPYAHGGSSPAEVWVIPNSP